MPATGPNSQLTVEMASGSALGGDKEVETVQRSLKSLGVYKKVPTLNPKGLKRFSGLFFHSSPLRAIS